MNNLMNKTVAIFLCLAVFLGSCGPDDEIVTISLDRNSEFFSGYSQTKSVTFTTGNAASVAVTQKPEGWVVEPNFATKTISITSPEKPAEEKEDSEILLSGQITFAAQSADGIFGHTTLFVAISDEMDISASRSNSYIVTEDNTYYHFDATYKGETSTKLDTKNVGLVWQSRTNLITSVSYNDGKASFYIKEKSSDNDAYEGNAVIAAYDANGDIIWSWHIWVLNEDPTKKAVVLGAKTFMPYNLGAFESKNDTEENILKSYGLYYQWGRKEPFVAPATYNAANATNATMYNVTNGKLTMQTVATDDIFGTEAYAISHPITFILGTEDSSYDWLKSAHTSTLWSDVKSVNDPCPKGWRVPSSSDFANLTISDDKASATKNSYGWNLADASSNTAFFLGAGRRVYKTGNIQNIYSPLPATRAEAQPWEGLYWTVDSAPESKSSSFYFFYNDNNKEASSVEQSVEHYRANGMQVRCVKM